MKKIKIAILDNGVYIDHIAFTDNKPNVIQNSDTKDSNSESGHGTAIYNIINKVISFADIINFNISDINGEIEQQSLISCLENIYRNYDDWSCQLKCSLKTHSYRNLVTTLLVTAFSRDI